MRVGRKHTKAVEVRQTRSCVVRLEKVSTVSPNVSPSLEDSRILTRTHRLASTGMSSTPKTRRGVNLQREEPPSSGSTKKKVASGASSVHGSIQTPQQQKATNTTISNVRSNQKTKVLAKPNKETSVPLPSKEETPPPTIAAGRSRRAIKPNPKYASEDLVTPKVVRNVGLLGSSVGRGGTTVQNKNRKVSTSSDDFYNRNSEDETSTRNADNDSHKDKAYQVSEKEDNDSDFSVVEESNKRSSRPRHRPKKNQEPALDHSPQLDNKFITQTRSTATTTAISSNLRSAPSQLQQIRRSLASANAQRSFNVFAGSNIGTARKRKIEEIQDSSDTESNYSVKRKQMVHTNSLSNKIKVPVKENKVNASSTPFNKSRLIAQIQKPATHQTINGNNKVNSFLASTRKDIEIAMKSNSGFTAKSSIKQPTPSATTNQHNKIVDQNSATSQTKIIASKAQKLRSDSPKPTVQKEKQSTNGAIVSLSSTSSNVSSSLKADSKVIEKRKTLNTNSIPKPKIAIPHHNLSAIRSEIVHEIKDDSPNSTMDDFETMPTFTIVNVNDIINKKGDVLITKTKSNSCKSQALIELSESISLDDDDEDDDNRSMRDEEEEALSALSASSRQKQMSVKKFSKPSSLHTRNEIEIKKSSASRSNEKSKLPILPPASNTAPKRAPQILNHKLGLRNSRVAAKTTTTLTAMLTSPDKPAPRILNSVVAKKTLPVKPMIANMDDSADESFPLSLDEDEDAEGESDDEIESKSSAKLFVPEERKRKRDYHNLMEVDTEDTESQNTEDDTAILQPTKTTLAQSSPKIGALAPKQNTNLQRRGRTAAASNNQIIVSSNQKRLTPAALKENSLAATNHQINDSNIKQTTAPTLPVRKSNAEKVVISKQGDKIIKKITCFETWYVINMPADVKRPVVIKNQLEMPLVQLANQAKNICLPNNMWSSKVTLYELSPQSLAKGTYATFTGDLDEHNISEEDRGKYQPSCVMFRRSIEKSLQSRMPYDRAVIFKNKTFYTNIEGKNIRLLGAPSIINCETEIEILLEIVDSINLQSDFVELVSVLQ